MRKLLALLIIGGFFALGCSSPSTPSKPTTKAVPKMEEPKKEEPKKEEPKKEEPKKDDKDKNP